MFRFPSLTEIFYRIRRLRRLIVVAATLPISCFAVLSIWLGASGEVSALGIISFGLICTGAVSAHAMLFPNATIEAISLSLGLVVIAVLEQFVPGGAGWRFFEAFLVILTIVTTQMPIRWIQMRGAAKSYVFKGQITTRKPMAEARSHFTMRPNRVIGKWTCGPADAQGMFQISMKVPEAFRSVDPDTGIDNTDERLQIPKQYAVISKDETTRQETFIFEENKNGKLDVISLVVNEFEETNEGCTVTEAEAPTVISRGLAFGMWLADAHYDSLVYMRDLLEDRPTCALKNAHYKSMDLLLADFISNYGLADPKA